LLGLNLSAQQIAAELDLNKDNAASGRANCVRASWRKNPKVIFSGEVECDELYLIAGKDQQDQVRKEAQRSLDAVESDR